MSSTLNHSSSSPPPSSSTTLVSPSRHQQQQHSSQGMINFNNNSSNSFTTLSSTLSTTTTTQQHEQLSIPTTSPSPSSNNSNNNNNNSNNNQSKQQQKKNHPKMVHALGGAISGVTSSFILAPLDTLKTRFIIHRATAGVERFTILEMIRQVVITERGGIRGLYRGLGPSLLGYIPNWSVYFLFYELFKEKTNDNHVVSSMSAGFITNFVTAPLWVIRTRMQSHQGTDKLYRSTFHALSHVVRHEGIRGLYSGLLPSMFGLIHVGIQFPCYEFLKSYAAANSSSSSSSDSNGNTSDAAAAAAASKDQYENQGLTWQRVLFASVVSKTIASVSAYPHEVIRSRLQMPNHQYGGVIHAIREIYSHEGIRAFYNGMGTNLLRVVPAALITLVTYEMSVKYISQWKFMRSHARMLGEQEQEDD